MSSVKVTLFHLNRCPPCEGFIGTEKKPGEWMKFLNSKGQINTKKVEIDSIELNEQQSKSNYDVPFINSNRISSFPTIKITTNGVEEEYKGDRLAGKLIEFINNRIDNVKLGQSGGNVNNDETKYTYKSLKYKLKYNNLKQMIKF